jgi:trans-aconitate methyltransferase
MFEELAARHPKRAETFAFAMEALATMFAMSVLVNNYDWESLGSATLVDVGGGKGFVCRTLAEHFPKMSFIVQDLEDTIIAGRYQLPEDLGDRVTFMKHDFFTPQPVKDADVYFFRAVFHNWPEKYCVRILQNLVPALKKGAKVIILDPHTPDPLTSQPWQDRQAR